MAAGESLRPSCVYGATAAQNAGRVSSYKRAQDMGIELEQEWLATMDNRTRHSHRQLDGERAPVGGVFSNGCRFPGDPDAPYAETMNCRCALVAAVEGIGTDDARRWSRLPAGTTYEEWKAARAAEDVKLREKHKLKNGRYAYSQQEVDEVIKRHDINVKTVVPITYNPRLRSYGATRYEEVFRGFNRILSIEIGPQKNGGEKELIDTILHEVLESKLLIRDDKLLEGGDDAVHPYIDKIIARYAKMKGLW